MLKKVKKVNLADMVVDQIKELIISQNLAPGYCIGTERKMCTALNVSRPVLREALANLKAHGFIKVTNSGVLVNSMTPAAMTESIEKVLEENEEKIFELMAVRKILESGMAIHAIDTATGEDIEKIKQALKNLERSHLNRELGDKENVAFHLALAESSHNSIYIHILHTFLDLFEKTAHLYRSKLFRKPGNADTMMEHHREIYNAFIAKDPQRLHDAIVGHLTWGDNELRRLREQCELSNE